MTLFGKVFRRFFHWFIGIRIRSKMFLSSFALISLMIAAIFCLTFFWFDDILVRQARKEMDLSLLQIKNNIENQLSQYQELSKSIFFNQDLLYQLTAQYANNLAAFDGFKKSKTILQTMKIADPTLSGISIYTFNRTFLADGGYFKYLDTSAQQEEWFQKLLHSNFGGVWLKAYRNGKGEYVFAFQRLLYEYKYSFQIAGVLNIELPASMLYNYISAESSNKTFYIMDENGYVITSSGGRAIDTNVRGETWAAEAYASDHGQLIKKIGGHEELITYYTLSNGWKLLVLTPIDILRQSTRKINDFIIGIYVAAIVLLLVITYFLADVLTRRIKMLYRGVLQVQKGEYTHKVELVGRDEVGQLAGAYNEMTDRLEYMFHEVYGSRMKMKELELRALQSQINPHFLNNVLSSIGWLALKKGAEDVHRMASETAKFYRFSLSVDRDVVTLAEELDQVRAYIAVQKIRFPNCIGISFEVDEKLHSYRLRKLTLQPLVENCINHGMREEGVPIHIRVRGFQNGEYTFVEIEDDGLGIPEDRLNTILSEDADDGVNRTSYGIKNVNERIKLHFGKDYGLTLASEADKGTTVTLRLPLNPAE